MIKHIATAAIYVEDQDKALEFYTKKLGFEKRNEIDMGTPDGARWLEVAPPGAETRLVLYPKKMMKDANERKPSLVFHCENIEDLCKDLKEKGVTFASELNSMPWGKFAMIEDLDGNTLMLRGDKD